MISTKNIEDIYKNKKLKEFIKENSFFNSKDKKMIGVTIDSKLNFIIKFYLDKTFDKNYICGGEFKTIFNMLKNKIDYSTPTSLATGIKIKSDNTVINYIHFKFSRNTILKPKSHKLKFIGIDDCKFGASIEKCDSNTVFKKYFYYFTKKDKELVKKLFNLNVDTNDVFHFEVYETKDTVKANIIYDFFKEEINFLDENNLLFFKESVNKFNSFFKKQPKYFGLDKNKNLSFYYSFTNESVR